MTIHITVPRKTRKNKTKEDTIVSSAVLASLLPDQDSIEPSIVDRKKECFKKGPIIPSAVDRAAKELARIKNLWKCPTVFPPATPDSIGIRRLAEYAVSREERNSLEIFPGTYDQSLSCVVERAQKIASGMLKANAFTYFFGELPSEPIIIEEGDKPLSDVSAIIQYSVDPGGTLYRWFMNSTAPSFFNIFEDLRYWITLNKRDFADDFRDRVYEPWKKLSAGFARNPIKPPRWSGGI